MDLKRKLDYIERSEIIYIVLGVLLIGIAALGLQFQDKDVKNEEGDIEVSLTLQKPNETVRDEINLDKNSTVFEAINQTYDVEYTDYDFGYFVTSIDGLAQNETHSWLYSVNNESANMAVNNYILQEDYNVSFRYTDEELE